MYKNKKTKKTFFNLDFKWIDDVQINLSAVERRTISLTKRRTVKKIAEEKKITMPIMEAIYNILYNHSPILDEINKLLDRPATDEFY